MTLFWFVCTHLNIILFEIMTTNVICCHLYLWENRPILFIDKGLLHNYQIKNLQIVLFKIFTNNKTQWIEWKHRILFFRYNFETKTSFWWRKIHTENTNKTTTNDEIGWNERHQIFNVNWMTACLKSNSGYITHVPKHM